MKHVDDLAFTFVLTKIIFWYFFPDTDSHVTQHSEKKVFHKKFTELHLTHFFFNITIISSFLDDFSSLTLYLCQIIPYSCYHMQGKITECWLAETEGIFP